MTNAKMNSAEPVPAGAWSERRFALTMLGAVTAITIALLILARIQLSYRENPIRLPKWDMTLLQFLFGYRNALFAVVSMYLIWGKAPLFVRTLLAISAIAITTHTYQVHYGHELEALPHLTPFFISVLLIFLFWQMAFRLTGLQIYRIDSSSLIVQQPAKQMTRWQTSLGQIFSTLLSVCFVLAFLRLLKYEYIQVMYQEDLSLFPTICVSYLAITILGIGTLSFVRLWWSLVIGLPLLFATFVGGIYFAYWLAVGMPFDITFGFFRQFSFASIAKEFFFPAILTFLFLLPFRLAGYRLAWKVPPSPSQTSTPLNPTKEKPTV